MRLRFRSSLWPNGLYLNWASRAPQPLPNNFVHAEWITLHDNPDFRGFVDFLRAELDRVGPAQADLPRESRGLGIELFPARTNPGFCETSQSWVL
jgi:hypothetical protein